MSFHDLLLRALDSPLGLMVATPDPEKLRAALYRERNKRPEFHALGFAIPDEPSTLFLVRTDQING